MRSLLRSVPFRVLVLVLAPLSVVLCLVLLDGIQERRDAEQDARRTAIRLAKAVAANQEQLIEEGRQLLTTIAKEPRLRGQTTACNLYLADLLRRWTRYANLAVAGPGGDVRCSGLPYSGGVNVSDRLYFQQALSTRDFSIGDYQIGRISGKSTISFGYPLLDASGGVTSIVIAALDLTWLNTLASDANLAPGTSIFVVDRKGVILARYPHLERWVGRSARGEAPVRAVLSGEQGSALARGLDGVERYYGFTPLPRSTQASPVYVSAGIPKATALAAAGRRLERNLAAVGLLAILAILTGWLGGRLLVANPVERRERRLRARAGTVARFGERLSTAGRNGSLPATILSEMADAADADVGALYVSHDADGALSLVAARGLDAARLPERLAAGEGRTGRALAERRPVEAAAPDSGLRVVGLGSELPVRHELHMPLFQNGRGLGVVALGRAGNGSFGPDELELLGHLAQQASAALAEANGAALTGRS